jgi:hypothetical protein
VLLVVAVPVPVLAVAAELLSEGALGAIAQVEVDAFRHVSEQERSLQVLGDLLRRVGSTGLLRHS